ncbi:CCHC-type domain-containing protein [Citrus sinensis]|uniref:CCHC-type domain-containing protein n=1 Tax=Citrus sinensis TaxID=2711 RepID=A0ACB8HRB4_CITSI|nr:CCHC-type domain-containing protein [Citrus sinensis]
MAEIDKKTNGTIILSLADSVIRELAKEPNVADLWAKLESIYMKKSLANRLYIKKRMFTLKMPEGSSLDEHLDEFNKVCDTLETIDAAFSDEDKALLLISSLPKSYEHFADALMYRRQTLSLDEVKSTLSTKELQGKQESLGNDSGEGLTVKARPEGKKKKQGKNKEKQKNLRCFLCHKEGHFKKDCPEKKFKKNGKDGDATVVEEEGYKYVGVCVATESRDRGKATRASFNRSVHKSKDKLEYVHSNLWGPAQQVSLRGYPEGVKGYKIWCTDLSPPRCIISRDVTFNERELLNQKSPQQPTEEGIGTGIKQQFEVEIPKSDDSLEAADSDGVTDSSAAHQIDEDEPKAYKEAVQSKFSKEWQQAIDKEIMRASIRVILALTAVQDMELDQLNVKTAFLHGRLQEKIFMTQPEGYVDSIKPRHVCLLKKSFYGLKQSPRQWYLMFDEFMITNGFMRCNYDCCVYFKLLEDDHYIYLLLYVDDMLIACKWREEIEKLKVMLNSEFDMKDLGTANKILGVEIKRNRTKGEIFLSQERYLTKVLEAYKMLDSKPVLTPLTAHFKLSNQLCPKTDEEKLDMKNVPYANVVSCLMYAMVLTRPDLSHSATLQHVVALSTTEAEYTAATEAVKETLWLQGLFEFLGSGLLLES